MPAASTRPPRASTSPPSFGFPTWSRPREPAAGAGQAALTVTRVRRACRRRSGSVRRIASRCAPWSRLPSTVSIEPLSRVSGLTVATQFTLVSTDRTTLAEEPRARQVRFGSRRPSVHVYSVSEPIVADRVALEVVLPVAYDAQSAATRLRVSHLVVDVRPARATPLRQRDPRPPGRHRRRYECVVHDPCSRFRPPKSQLERVAVGS